MFDPKTNKFPYPELTDKHYLHVKKNRGIVFNKDYPYVDKSKSFRRRQDLFYLAMRLIAFPAVRIRLGLKVEGRDNLKKYQDVLSQGVVSCCNHVHMWDYLGILYGVRPRRTHILSWAPNINGENGTMIRMVGGIPIPEQGLRASLAYANAVRDLLNEGGWLHVYSEGSMWEFYGPIRPFKAGGAFFASKYHKPILPLAYSYREPGWIRKHIFRQIACLTLHIGEPIYADASLPPQDRADELTVRSHRAVCRLAGIDPENNPYPPLFAEGSRRVDYYTDTYGVGYHGSW